VCHCYVYLPFAGQLQELLWLATVMSCCIPVDPSWQVVLAAALLCCLLSSLVSVMQIITQFAPHAVHLQDYDGSNLAQWLVNKPETVKDELESYSQGFLQFWRKERAAYWPMVEKKKKDYGVKQKEEDKRANALNDPVVSLTLPQVM
jgi:hypothetical protein